MVSYLIRHAVARDRKRTTLWTRRDEGEEEESSVRQTLTPDSTPDPTEVGGTRASSSLKPRCSATASLSAHHGHLHPRIRHAHPICPVVAEQGPKAYLNVIRFWRPSHPASNRSRHQELAWTTPGRAEPSRAEKGRVVQMTAFILCDTSSQTAESTAG